MGSHDPDEIARRRDAAALRREDSLKDEVERLRQQIKEQQTDKADLYADIKRLRAEAEFHGKRAVEFATRIEAALAEAEWLTHTVSIGQERLIVAAMVKALRGDK